MFLEAEKKAFQRELEVQTHNPLPELQPLIRETDQKEEEQEDDFNPLLTNHIEISKSLPTLHIPEADKTTEAEKKSAQASPADAISRRNSALTKTKVKKNHIH